MLVGVSWGMTHNMGNIIAGLGGIDKAAAALFKVVIVIIIVVLLNKAWKRWLRRDAGKAWVDPTKLDPSKNYQNIAKQVSDVFDRNWVSSEAAEKLCKSLLFLNDNELREINNQYLRLYGNGTRTLQDAISDMYVCISCDARKLLLDRLDKLNLY